MSRDPYTDLPSVERFQLRSDTIADGRALDRAQVSGVLGAGGADLSPQLSWSAGPAGTPGRSPSRSMTRTPLPRAISGIWAAFNIPLAVHQLPVGASGGGMPAGTVELTNDGGTIGYVGAAPPPGDGLHHYWTVVHAVDVPALDIPATASPAFLGFQLYSHTLARAAIVATYRHRRRLGTRSLNSAPTHPHLSALPDAKSCRTPTH